DIFCMGHLKFIVYETPVENVNDLLRRIIQECRAIPVETFQNIEISEFENSLYYCLENNGEHFEHLL
ncbi:hypothetical protein EAG_10492, partial [Camponotus floridanus]